MINKKSRRLKWYSFGIIALTLVFVFLIAGFVKNNSQNSGGHNTFGLNRIAVKEVENNLEIYFPTCAKTPVPNSVKLFDGTNYNPDKARLLWAASDFKERSTGEGYETFIIGDNASWGKIEKNLNTSSPLPKELHIIVNGNGADYDATIIRAELQNLPEKKYLELDLEKANRHAVSLGDIQADCRWLLN